MSYTIITHYTLYRLEEVQKELGVNDLLDWSRLIAGYDINPKMVTCQGYTGMEEAEKNRLVRELKERLATMAEIQKSVPAKMRPYSYKKIIQRSFTLYTMEDVYREANLDGKNNFERLNRIAKGWNPQPEIIERNGYKGFGEQEKARLVKELEQLKTQYEEQERKAYLDKIAMRESHALPSYWW